MISKYRVMEQKTIDLLNNEDIFNLIGKQWMLVTAGNQERFNTMTASWGGIGWLWNKPVAFVFVRPERYTHEFIEANERFTLSFYGRTIGKPCSCAAPRADEIRIKWLLRGSHR